MRARGLRRAGAPGSPVPEVATLDLAQTWVALRFWVKDAFTFYPWEVSDVLLVWLFFFMPWAALEDSQCTQEVSSYELAPRALIVLEKENVIRKPMIRLVRWKLFDWTMLTVILANCVTLAMDSNRPGFPESTMGMALTKANYVFIGIFMFEAACKIIALGFLFAEHTYLRSGRFHQCFMSVRSSSGHDSQVGTYWTSLSFAWESWSSPTWGTTPSSGASGP